MRNDKKSKIIEIEIVLQHRLTLLYQQNIGNPSLNSPLAPPSMNALNTTASVFYFIILRPFFWEIEFKKRWEIELWEAIGERHR
jgi:hypothetical protein